MERLRLGVVAALLLTAMAGCSGKGRVDMPSLSPQAAGRQALSEYDTNKDGFIDGAELDQCPGLKAALARIDKNGDGRLVADEIAARLVQYQEDKVALTFVIAAVTINGQPLKAAEVTLVPEKFMGSAVKPARGVTDDKGLCTFATDGEELDGAHSGVFRVTVSKKDAGGQETLPARYNRSTTLGTEVWIGAREIPLNLKSR